jgi:hypothetical protein
MILALLLFCLQFRYKTVTDESRMVYIKKANNGFQLIRNGSPFYIRGAAGNSHFGDLRECGGNTIRLYDTINLGAALNEAAKYGLAAIVDIPIPVNRYSVYESDSANRILMQKTRDFVRRFKNFPALLMWNLGNEVNYPGFSWKYFFRSNKFINTFNELIAIVHHEDAEHLLSTSLWNTTMRQLASIRIFSPALDIYSFNVFADIHRFNSKIDKFFKFFMPIPYYLSEFGSDGYWESLNTAWLSPIEQTSTKKVEQINTRYKIVTQDKDCLGSLIFFWGFKYEHTYSWFSLFMGDHKSEVIKELNYLWKKSAVKPSLIGLNYMLLDGKGAAKNIVLAPGQQVVSEIVFTNDRESSDSITVKWEIYPEGWNYDEDDMFFRPKPINYFFTSIDKNKVSFNAPLKEGPYRIFVYIYDKEKYFATTNTPFYVLNTK